MSKMNIPVILGTARKDRKSIKAAEFILNELNSEKIKTKLIDVRDYRLKATDNTESTEKAKKFAEQVINADALIIVSPEYNHFFPGELKMLLDMLYSQYNSKPVALIGVSKGIYGGIRMIKQLQLQVLAFKMILFPEFLLFPEINSLFDEKNKLKDKKLIQKTKEFIKEFKKFTEKNKTQKK